MQSNMIAPKKEVKNASNPETVVFKDTSVETSDNPAKPSSTIKKNQKEHVEVLKNLKRPAEDSKDLLKPKDVDAEIGKKPKEVSKELKSGSDKDVVSTKKVNVEESKKEEGVEVIELIEEQPMMETMSKIDSEAMKDNKKTAKNDVQKSEEVEKGDKLEQKPSDANESKNSKSTTKIEIDASKTKAKESTKPKQLIQKIKQFFVKWNIFWTILLVIVFFFLFIWLLSVLDPKMTKGGVGGSATHSFGSGSGATYDFGNSDENHKVTGKK